MMRLKKILKEFGFPEDLGFTDFAGKRFEGASKIASDAKEKGGVKHTLQKVVKDLDGLKKYFFNKISKFHPICMKFISKIKNNVSYEIQVDF